MSTALRIANVGAEEGEGAPGGEAAVRARGLAALWRALFDPPPAFPWLAAGDGAAFAWLVTAAAAREAAADGRRLVGAPPDVVDRVHDKAFALEVARREGLLAPDLAEAIEVLEPELLRDADAAAARIEAVLARWPAAWRAAFTLKPRRGTSARGRVAGRDGRVDAALRGALARLAARGGALLEPWLPRLQDLSAQLRVDEGGMVVLLGTLEVRSTPAGVVRGHRGQVDPRVRVGSGSAFDEALREAAVEVARAAAEAGYRGPCGVDAFVYADREGRPRLRAVCELNARFTAGTVAIGHLRRALPAHRTAIGLAPGAPRPFLVALDLARADEAKAVRAGARSVALPTPDDGAGPGALRPRLLLASDPAALEDAWAALGV